MNPSRDNSQFYDFGDVTFPITAGGSVITTFEIGKVGIFSPVNIEYIEDANGDYNPIYYVDYDKIVLPKSSTEGEEYKLELYDPSSIIESWDPLAKRFMLKKDMIENIIYKTGTEDVDTFTFQLSGARIQITPTATLGMVYLMSDRVHYVNQKPDPDNIRAVFDYQNNTPSEIVNLGGRGRLIEPEEPEWHGYTFVGWFEDLSSDIKWDFMNDIVEEDMTIYAKWSKDAIYYDVLFDSQG